MQHSVVAGVAAACVQAAAAAVEVRWGAASGAVRRLQIELQPQWRSPSGALQQTWWPSLKNFNILNQLARRARAAATRSDRTANVEEDPAMRAICRADLQGRRRRETGQQALGALPGAALSVEQLI